MVFDKAELVNGRMNRRHNLMDNGERFIERQGGGRERAWHVLGTTFDDGEGMLSASEAFRRVGLDAIRYGKYPVVTFWQNPADANDRRMLKAGGVTGSHCYIVREPMGPNDDPVILGDPVDANYGLIQASDIMRMLDPLAKKWKLETAGALGKGETIFASLNSGNIGIKGVPGKNAKADEITGYFVIANFTNGRRSAQLFFGPTRAVCQNTLALALSQATSGVKIPHTAAALEQMDFYVRLMTSLTQAQERTIEVFQGLASLPGTEEGVKEIIHAALPLKAPTRKLSMYQALRDGIDLMPVAGDDLSGEAVKLLMEQFADQEQAIVTANETIKAQRADVQTLYERERADFPGHGRYWLAVNAVVEYVDWMRSARMSAADQAFQANLEGPRLQVKHRAAEKALELAGSGRR